MKVMHVSSAPDILATLLTIAMLQVVTLTREISGIKDAMTVLQQQPSLHLLRQLSSQHPHSASAQPTASSPSVEAPSTTPPSAPAQSHPLLNTLSITDIIAQGFEALGLQPPMTPDNVHSSNRGVGLLDTLLLDAAPSTRPELVVTNPVYLDGDLQSIIPSTPAGVPPSPAVLQQVCYTKSASHVGHQIINNTQVHDGIPSDHDISCNDGLKSKYIVTLITGLLRVMYACNTLLHAMVLLIFGSRHPQDLLEQTSYILQASVCHWVPGLLAGMLLVWFHAASLSSHLTLCNLDI